MTVVRWPKPHVKKQIQEALKNIEAMKPQDSSPSPTLQMSRYIYEYDEREQDFLILAPAVMREDGGSSRLHFAHTQDESDAIQIVKALNGELLPAYGTVPSPQETVKHTAPTPNWICESCGAENLPTVTCCQVCKEWKVEEMVKQFEQYLSPLVRCGYSHAIIQLREWLASLPAGEISLDVQLDKMEKEKQQVDKALLGKELEAYQKNRALAQEEIANLKLENEKLKFFIENESRRLVESVVELEQLRAEKERLRDILSKAEKILFRVEFAGDPVNESDFYKEIVAALGVDSKQQ